MTGQPLAITTQLELLDTIPKLTGFSTNHSLVCIGFRDNLGVGAFRCDIDDDRDATQFSHFVIGLAARLVEATEFVLALYTARPQPYPELVAALHLAFERAGCQIREVLWRTPQDWGSYPARLRHHKPLVDAIERALYGTDCSAVDAIVIQALAHADQRDVVLAQWAFGGDVPEIDHRAAAWSECLLGHVSIGPDPERITLAIAACQRLRVLGPSQADAALWSIEAWCEWARGRGSAAVRCCQRARAAEPNYAFAELFERFIATGAIPDWAFTHRTDAAE